MLIAQKLPNIPRLGVDPKMISKLGVKRQDLEERHKAPKKHLDPLPPDLRTEVKKKRIEIDAVSAVVGPNKLWNYLEERMLESAAQRDLTRSVDLTIPLVPEISTPLAKIVESCRSIGAPKQEDIKTKFRNWTKGFLDIEKVEKASQSKILRITRKDHRIQELAKQLSKLADNISKNSQKRDSE